MNPNKRPADSDDASALWAAGGLTPEEEREILKRAATDAALAAELKSMAGVVNYLAECAEPVAPPERIKNDILKRMAGRVPKITVRRQANTRWEKTSNPLISRRMLSIDRERGVCTILMRMAPGGVLEGHVHSRAEECLVLSGDLVSNGEVLGPGDYFYAEPGSEHADLTTLHGCECLLITAIGD